MYSVDKIMHDVWYTVRSMITIGLNPRQNVRTCPSRQHHSINVDSSSVWSDYIWNKFLRTKLRPSMLRGGVSVIAEVQNVSIRRAQLSSARRRSTSVKQQSTSWSIDTHTSMAGVEQQLQLIVMGLYSWLTSVSSARPRHQVTLHVTSLFSCNQIKFS